MPITVKHTKVSAIPDDADTSLVRPSDWNADHTLVGLGTMAEQNANSVAITGGTISGVSGIGTVTSVAATAGTGISVTGSPITTSGTLNITNTAPDQVVSLTGAGTTSISGSYPNFTITSTGGSGGGDVSGPASSTDNALTRFDGTTGKLIQNSVVTVGDAGAVSGVTTLAASTSVTTPIIQATNSAGLALKNSAGTTQISMGAGGGDNMSVNVSTNLNGTNAQIDISPTGTGHVHIKPTGTGSLEIAPTNVGTIDNMTIGGTTARAITGTTITGTSFVGSGASLTNVVNSLAASTGISVSGSTGAVTVTNTAPDQTVVLTGGTGISTSGTYPNFTITNTAPSSGGTVTSVSGNAPISSSGGNTPAISISQATTSTDGYLSSTDWNTFNGKQPAGTYVTSVGATSPVTTTGGTTPTIAMPAATTSVSGYLTSTDWNTFDGKYGLGSSPSFAGITDTGNLTFTGTGNRITGDFSNATSSNRVAFQTSTTNGATRVMVIPNGTGNTSSVQVHNSSDIDNASSGLFVSSSVGLSITSGASGTASYLPMIFFTGGFERLRITSSGGVSFGSSGTAYGTSGQVLTSAGNASPTWSNTITSPTLTTATTSGKFTFGGAIDETVYAVVDAAGVALSPSNGTIQTWTLGASRTPTAGTWDAGESITMMIDDGTARTITWTTLGVVWVGGAAPTLATTGSTVIELWKVGSTIYGALVGSVA